MLKPAQLYKEQLQEANYKTWYRPEYRLYHGGTGSSEIKFDEDNCDRHQLVSVDADDNVLGYISYNIDWSAMSVSNFGIMSFKLGSIEFLRDVYKAICDIFEVYNMNRLHWFAYADNSAIRGYYNFIKKHGGRQCGYYRQIAKLYDGKMHDAVEFEILAEEFKK